MAQVPREIFVPAERRELSYIDEAQPVTPSVGPTRYIPAPAPFARLVQLAAVSADDKVLDLGCTTGYSAAVLGQLAYSVVAVDSDPGLAALARANLAMLHLNSVVVLEAPIAEGARDRGPFDVILLEGTVDEPPRHLFTQLAESGRLVVLQKQGAAAVAHLYVKSGTDVASRVEFNTTLPPLYPTKAPPAFVF
jgi:protein-L-isoaspartate(D-aspartate) O-methyltransferase